MILSHPITYYVVRCDNCGNQNRSVADGFGSQEEAEVDALQMGWESDGHTHLCARCLQENPDLLQEFHQRLLDRLHDYYNGR